MPKYNQIATKLYFVGKYI